MLVTSVLASLPALSSSVGATVRPRPLTQTAPFYLDLGASVSLGVEPTLGPPRTHRTSHGYANHLTKDLRMGSPRLFLVHLGCPGESLPEMLTGADPCNRYGPSQLSLARNFLLAHSHSPGLVTIDMGFNDIAPCLRNLSTANVCLHRALTSVSTTLPNILAVLVSAAPSHTTIIGLNHYDPYAAYRKTDPPLARIGSRAIVSLNRVLARTYSAYHIPVADVAEAFATAPLPSDLYDSPTKSPPSLDTPRAAALACHLTWMCAKKNIHPTNAGYRLMAQTIYRLIDSLPSARYDLRLPSPSHGRSITPVSRHVSPNAKSMSAHY